MKTWSFRSSKPAVYKLTVCSNEALYMLSWTLWNPPPFWESLEQHSGTWKSESDSSSQNNLNTHSNDVDICKKLQFYMSKNPVKSPTSSDNVHPQSLMGLHCMSNFSKSHSNKNANNFQTNVNWKPLFKHKNRQGRCNRKCFCFRFLILSSIYLEGSVPKTLARKLIKREQIPKKEKREFYDNCRNFRAFIG